MRALRRRRGDEKGAVAVEAALVMPLLVLLIFGIIEFSLLLRDYAAITNSTRAGVRLASAEANAGPCATSPTDTTQCTAPTSTPQLTQDAADAVDQALTGVPESSIDYLLVFEANKSGYPCTSATIATCPTNTAVPTTLTSCSAYANCVMYTWNPTKGAFRYTSGAWNSTTISACVNAQDNVGIYLKATHGWLTGLFGTSIGLSDRSIAKFEPLAQDECAAGKHQ